jgi:hypothetical protein
MSKPIRQVWQFTSDSNPDKQYETLRYIDGSTSCNCPGWTRRVAADGTRSCKHTRAVDMGRADPLCSATHRYQPETPKPETQSHAQITETPKLGQRRFAV